MKTMSQLAIYRKYRPSTFADVIGQEQTVKILREASRQNRFSHAYIFAGPRGSGKTTLARLVAKSANCQKKKDGEACNKCSSCEEINAGKSLDLVEIDGASNRGIDEIREVRENARFAAASGQNKIFIIDEAHMLTPAAFNALLKTLEEPAANIIFILATTEIEKIPVTIRSRSQQFFFKKISVKEIIGKLETIAKTEKIKIDAEAVNLIATAAEGSFRDAESLLNQLLVIGDKKIELEEVENMIGRIGFAKLAACAELILKNTTEKILQEINLIYDGGYNISQFTKDLIQHLRRAAVLKYNPEIKTLLTKEMSVEHLALLENHSKLFQEAHLKVLKSLMVAYGQMRYSQFPIINLEVALIESLKK